MAQKEIAQPSMAALSTALPDRATLLALLVFVLATGGAAIAVRFTYAELPPFSSATARFGCAAVFFWIVVWVRKIPLPRGRALLGAVLFGVLTVGLTFGFAYWGLTKTPASLFQTLMALVPLLTLFFAALHGVEPFRRRGLLGALLAVVGIAIAVGGFGATEVSLPHILAIVASAASVSEGGIVVKLFPRSHPLATNAVALPVAALMLGVAAWLSGEQPTLPTLAATWIALAYSVVFATIVTFLLYLFVLGRWTASGTAYGLVLAPLVTVVLASWLAKEQITWLFMLGGTLVVLGVWIGALLPERTHPLEP